jgi:GT2 family glycosyltransferase
VSHQRQRSGALPTVGCVVLSMGNRRDELDRALRSLLDQAGVTLDVLVVGNGWQPEGLPAGVRSLPLADNVGIPEGRNIGAAAVTGEIVLFFDDDAEWPDPHIVAEAAGRFAADPSLGIVQPRAVDPGGAATARRHVPRLRVSDPTRPGDVGWFWEGCCFIRRACFEAVGGWPGAFFYGHEGVEVAWRAVDSGWRIAYAADLEVRHPAVAPSRHAVYRFNNARNRVWVARRNLPHPLLELYLAVWFIVTVARLRDPAELRTALRGFAAGFREPAGERRPISWSGAWRLTRLGRPPIV